MQNNHDIRLRFLFDHAPVRGIHVRLDEAWQKILSRKNYPQPIVSVLGELLAGSVLLASNLKFNGKLILQVQGQGCLKMLVAEATSDNTCRATARWQGELNDAESLKELLGPNGIFVLTLEPEDGESWQGIVELTGQSISQMLMDYMARSEQLETYLSLACDDTHASGFLLQKLPEGHGDENEWDHLQTLGQTIKREELLNLSGESVLYRLFHADTPRVFEPESIDFMCTCSREKVGDMLKLIGGQEVGEVLLEQGSIEINCDFCHQQYVFDEEDVTDIFGVNVVLAIQNEAIRDKQENS